MSTKTNRFDTLLARWNEHQELRHQGADIADLYESSLALDSARRELGSR